MKTVRIGLLAPLTGASATMGVGFVQSARFALSQKSEDLAAAGLRVEFECIDYKSNPIVARDETKRVVRERGVLAFVGPCDSSCAHELILTGAAGGCALISPLVTATEVTKLGASNFFRLTSSDRLRAEVLAERVVREYPGVRPMLWSIADEPSSYSHALRADVIAEFERKGRGCNDEEIPVGGLPSKIPDHHQPLVCCCVSSETVRLVSAMSERGFGSPIFSFGSNTNLLVPALAGTIVVTDVDRHDTDPNVLKLVERFEQLNTPRSDPSVATMNCVGILCNLLIRHAESIAIDSVDASRARIIDQLRSETQKGMFRTFRFDSDGEMIGHEQISLLEIRRGPGGLTFVRAPETKQVRSWRAWFNALAHSMRIERSTGHVHDVWKMMGHTLAIGLAFVLVTVMTVMLDLMIRRFLADGLLERGSFLYSCLRAVKYVLTSVDFVLIVVLAGKGLRRAFG